MFEGMHKVGRKRIEEESEDGTDDGRGRKCLICLLGLTELCSHLSNDMTPLQKFLSRLNI